MRRCWKCNAPLFRGEKDHDCDETYDLMPKRIKTSKIVLKKTCVESEGVIDVLGKTKYTHCV